ncbi:rod shape-determining protein MreD [Thalassobius vesicularis]|uniref:Rod shape-determining protein MreD n=1 Tax=Thalassobius vesicularis TaxID=1294297 RepID=A0A4S3MCF4_9RHOB|nr:rod shape-determining protein MreD [Thalassobius vesicularis]THD76350.1 rod shape-determining protein MreD [Thalassobius vesicularis]
MTENASLQLWIMRAGYLSLGLMIIFFQLLPLQTLPSSFAGPDLIVAFTFAWAVRRPDHVPALSIAVLMLTADMLFQRPPGLAAALTVLATQALKRRAAGLRDQTFAVEWLTVGVTVIVLMLSARLVLSVLLIPQAPLGLTLMQTVMTVIAYPPAAAITAFVFGVQKQQPGDADAIGGRT